MSNSLEFFKEMKRLDASDLYLTVGRPASVRVNGVIQNLNETSLSKENLNQLTTELLDEEQQAEFKKDKEHNIALYYPELGRFRVNAYVQKAQTAFVIRKIESDIKTIDDLNLPNILKDLSMAKRGLLLVVGATGSGKSTTLAAMIDHRNRNEAGHIITIEDPVEFVHDHKKCVVSQREVGMDTDAETGHLCLATLHSNNANQTMERIINFFPVERQRQIYLQLSLNLKGIISQRLIRTPSGSRTAAIEILVDSARAKELIKKGEIEKLKEAMISGSTDGMQTFDDALLDLYKKGVISEKEALANSDSPTDLKLKIKLNNSTGQI